jgi:hypothetical protein
VDAVGEEALHGVTQATVGGEKRCDVVVAGLHPVGFGVTYLHENDHGIWKLREARDSFRIKSRVGAGDREYVRLGASRSV